MSHPKPKSQNSKRDATRAAKCARGSEPPPKPKSKNPKRDAAQAAKIQLVAIARATNNTSTDVATLINDASKCLQTASENSSSRSMGAAVSIEVMNGAIHSSSNC